MAKKERMKKPSTRRSGPIRNSGIFKSPNSSNGASRDQNSDPVSQAYSVMEEQMRQGALGAINAFRDQASNFSIPNFLTNNPYMNAMNGMNGNSGTDFFSQWMSMYTQMLNLGAQSFESMADMRNGQSDGVPFPSKYAADEEYDSDSREEDVPHALPVRMNINCRKAAAVVVDFRKSPNSEWQLQPLISEETPESRIDNASLEINDDIATLNINVPRGMAKGTYSGTIIDNATDTVCGKVLVTL